jgi:uncharacterized membrane protein YfbV (UPF0208 family)
VNEHPIRLVVRDDLRRSRLTVFFRLLLAIPHLVWLLLWTIAAILATIANWFATLVQGRSPDGLHRFLSAYARYATHVFGYLYLAASPFPPFQGAPGTYPIDLEIDPPAPQNRWKTAFRLVLAVPALLIVGVLRGGKGEGGGGVGDGPGGPGRDEGPSFFFSSTGVVTTVAVLAWFACLALARMPHGFRNLIAYGLRYSAQTFGYLTLLTDRYPNSDPLLPAEAGPPPRERPIRLAVADDLSRSRLTVFFRLLLALPHFVWLALWTIAALVAMVANWFATLVRGRSPDALHRFLSAYLRYEIHVFAFFLLVANPFPGFVGRADAYPVDLEIDPPAQQSRWITGFRLPLAIPALLVEFGLTTLLFVAGFLGWFAALATGRMPRGLRNLGAYSLRYTGEAYGYLFLLTERYPHSSPPVESPPAAEELPAAA